MKSVRKRRKASGTAQFSDTPKPTLSARLIQSLCLLESVRIDASSDYPGLADDDIARAQEAMRRALTDLMGPSCPN